jgi:hypothetical protein
LVRSESRRGLIYEVEPDFCPCEAFQFNSARDAAYRCKHIRTAFPVTPTKPVREYCYHCGQYPVIGNGIACRHCQDAKATCRHEWNDSHGPDFTCIKCGQVYTYEPDAPVAESPVYAETLTALTGTGYGPVTMALHGQQDVQSFFARAADIAAERNAAAVAAHTFEAGSTRLQSNRPHPFA